MQSKRLATFLFIFISALLYLRSETKNNEFFPVHASNFHQPNPFSIKTNILPWLTATPNIGVEFAFENKWSTDFNIMFSPWKISEKYSIKTIAILPELRYWFKNNNSGSNINIHFTAAWYNMRFNKYRYQDNDRPLIGAGIGYGYKLNLSRKFGMEFTIGAGFVNLRYDRFYNVDNGSLIDTRHTTYWGIDRLGITLVYNISNL